MPDGQDAAMNLPDLPNLPHPLNQSPYTLWFLVIGVIGWIVKIE